MSLEDLSAGMPWTAQMATIALKDVVESNPVDRRDLLLLGGTALLTPLTEWATIAPELTRGIQGGRVGVSMVARIEASVDTLRFLDAEIGSGSLIGIARPQLAMIVRVLGNGRYDTKAGRRLYRAASDLAGLLGWFLVDNGRHTWAQQYFLAALRASHVADDPLIGAAALSFMAVQSYSVADPRDAPRLAQAARDRIQQCRVPLVESMLLIREARGLAKIGDRKACEQVLSQAANRLAKGPTSRDPGWLYWMSEGEFHGQAGSCFMQLERYDKAVQHFQKAFDAYSAFCVRDRALCLTRKATALVRLNKSDEGHAEALKAVDLAAQINSARLEDHMRIFHAALVERGPIDVAEDFRERAFRLLGLPMR
ncbi:MAG TPA: hypothetical protein VGP31_08095 [Planosporangium sp.]|jgi:tetratricopeptide (TPR) repeat protein|nr:hypothetical protein [Planosporangium sp.]